MSLEKVFNSAVEAIALSPADKGLPVASLWDAVSDAAASLGSATLPPTLRRALWRMLGEREGDLRAHIPAAGAVPARPLTWAAPEMTDPTTAEAAGVHLLASPALQDAALGIYAARLSRFQISADQRRTLAVLGQAKGRGALQSRLTAELVIEPRNYHYVIKNLEERGLVVKTPTVLHNRGGSGVTTTNLIMLSKFAPQAMRPAGARLHDGRNATMAGAGVPLGGGASGAPGDDDDMSEAESESEEDEGGPSGGGEGTGASGPLVVINDDDARLQRITDFLATQPAHSMSETELKRELGYVGTPGHRRWRRMRKILLRHGCIERFKAFVGNTSGPVGFGVRLVKAYAPQEEEEWPIRQLLDPVTKKLDVYGSQVAEITIDRQILRMLAQAGAEGVTTTQLDQALRINMKRNEPRLKELRVKLGEGGVTEAHVNMGKMRMLKFTASDTALAMLDTALTGVAAGDAAAPPPGGFLAAVREAIAAGLNADGTNPLELLLAREGGDGGAEEGEGEGGEGEAGPSAAQPMAVEGEGADAVAGPSSAAVTNTEQQPEPAPEAPVRAKRARKAAPTTELAALRRQWLVDVVRREGVLLQAEASSFLQAQERDVRGNPKAVRPDKKVLQRVIDAAVEAGELSVVLTTLPGSHASQSRPVTVLVRPGLEADAGFVSMVMERHKTMKERIRRLNKDAINDQRREPEGETLPVLQKAARPRHDGADVEGEATATRAHGDQGRSHREMVENGLLPSRILRIRRAHDAVCEAVAARNGTPCSDLHPDAAAAVGEGKVFTVTHVPAGAPGALGSATRPLAMAPYCGGAEEAGLVVSTDELWSGMAVDTFLQCIGTRTEDKATVARLRRDGATLGSMSKHDLRALAGGKAALLAAKSRMVHLLDCLHNMGLIASLVPLGDTAAAPGGGTGGPVAAAGQPKISISMTTGGSAAWVLRTTAQYEELIGEAEDEAEEDEEEDGGGGRGGGGGAMRDAASGSRPATVTHMFDVSSPAGRAAYWHSMQFMVMCTAHGATARAVSKSLQHYAFPFFLVNELASERSWVGKAITSMEQVTAVMKSLHGYDLPRDVAAGVVVGGGAAGGGGMELDAGGGGDGLPAPEPGEVLTWQAAVALADQLGVPFEAVARGIMREHNHRRNRAGKRSGMRRLGGLGARRLGGAGAPRGRRGRLKRRRDGEDSSSGAEDFADEDLGIDFGLGGDEGIGGVAGGLRPAIQRKKRWYDDEDRALLRAWARWLADKGPDAILRWKFVKGRPAGVMPHSLKRRLQRLRENETVGASILRIAELAVGVHSRRVRRAAAETDVSVGDKRTAADEAEEGEKEGVHVHKKSRGEDGTVLEGQQQQQEQEPSAVMAEAATLRPKLWSLVEDADAEALRTVLAEIEYVVAEAPARHKAPRLPENARALAAAAAIAAATRTAGRALGGAIARGPLHSTRQLASLRMWARAAAEARAAGAAAAALPAPVAAAMELTKALLLAVREGAPADASFSFSLTARFAADDIKAAVAELIRLGHVSVGGGAGGRAAAAAALHRQGAATGGGLMLSSRFLAETQPLFLPGAVFAAEGEAEVALLAAAPTPPQQRATTRTLFPEDSVTATTNAQQQREEAAGHYGAELSGGGVAAALARGLALALGSGPSLELGVSLPRSVKVPSPPAAAAPTGGDAIAAAGAAVQREEDEEEVGDVVLRMLSSIKVTATLRPAEDETNGQEPAPPSASAGFAPTGPRFSLTETGALGRSAASATPNSQEVAYSAAEEVLFQPALVATSRNVRARAETAAKRLFASKRIGRGAATAQELVAALETAGGEGLTVAAATGMVGGSAAAASEALAALCRVGLARRVTGYDDVRAVASGAVKDRLAFPPPGADAEAALAPLGLPAQGKPQPCADVPIRPWVDHAGRFRRGLWSAIARRAVAIAAAAPGAPADVLLQAMRVVNPQHGREALMALCAAGVLRAQRQAAPAPPRSVLAACFGAAASEAPKEGQSEAVYGAEGGFSADGPEDDSHWHFFADPVLMWRAGDVLSPAVLVPVPVAGEGVQ